ncbi:uncharacterized protein [Miscanthus floridulus]|uniref:uncharacterized protein isoform X1 n=1 Tax=Miscanthus floridulus TaxID=154761 RepID=UPI003459EEF7
MTRFEEGGEEAVKTTRPPVSRRSLCKILSWLHVDVWTAQHDAKFLDLLLLRGMRGGADVGDLTVDYWSSAICTEFNAATGSAFPVEDLQRRLAELRREFDAVNRIKDHPRFTYDAPPGRRRQGGRVEAENPDAVAYEGRSTHFGRLQAIRTGGGVVEKRRNGGLMCRESRAKRCLGLRCNL